MDGPTAMHIEAALMRRSVLLKREEDMEEGGDVLCRIQRALDGGNVGWM